MTKRQVLDLYFGDARCKLVELAAFLDRVDRASGPGDHRIEALREALGALQSDGESRAKAVLLSLSDPTTDPIPAAGSKGATGAWPGREGRPA